MGSEKINVKQASREVFLDLVKGVAIIVVMFSHSCGIPKIGRYLVGFYVPVFFVITGYLYHDGSSFKALVKKRARQILLPYFAVSSILVILTYIEYAVKEKHTWQFIIQSIIGVFYGRYMLGISLENPIINFEICHNHPLWFMPAMFGTCVLFYWLKSFILYRKEYLYYIVILICLFVAYLLNKLPVNLPWSLDTLPVFIILMIFGNWLKCVKKSWFSFGRNYTCTITYLLLSSVYIFLCQDSSYNIAIGDYGKYGITIYLIRAMIGSALVLVASAWITQYLEFYILEMIGRYTMALMCWHLLFFDAMDGLFYSYDRFVTWLRINKWNYYIYSAVQMVVVIILIVLGTNIYHGIKRERLYEKDT